MKSLVVYYTHYGNTAYATYALFRALNKYGEANIVKLEYKGGGRNLLKRLLYKMMPVLVNLAPITTDLRDYDVLCLGIPVLAGRPSSAISKYISICKNIDKKKIICLYVYGFEGNAKRCSKYVTKILQRKEHPIIIDIYVSWLKVRDGKVISNLIEEAIHKIGLPPT